MKMYRSARAGREILRTYDALLAAWATAVEERDVPTRYGLTHVVAAGEASAPPLVLLHGVGDDSALMWLYNAAALAKHFRIYAVDTLGGPGKSRPDARYGRDFEDVLWLDDVWVALGLTRACMAGVSHGGYMAQLYALQREERVAKAVAIASSVPVGEGKSSPMGTMLRIFLPEALLPTPRNVARLIRKLSGAHADAFLQNKLVMEHYTWLLKGFSPASMGYHKVRTFSQEEIDRIRSRVLYLVGEADPFQELGGRTALEENGMAFVAYPDAGHGLNHELAETVNAHLVDALAGIAL